MAENGPLKRTCAALLVVAAVIAVVAFLRGRERGEPAERPDAAALNAAPVSSPPTRPRAPRTASERENVVAVVAATSAGRPPLPDVVVTMHRRGAGEKLRSTSDGSGRATFVGLADGAWFAEATSPGHEFATATCAVTDGVLGNQVELVLRKKGVVRGVVHDAAGSVAASALRDPGGGSVLSVNRPMVASVEGRRTTRAFAATAPAAS